MLQVVTIAGAVKSPRAEGDLMTLVICQLVDDEILETNL